MPSPDSYAEAVMAIGELVRAIESHLGAQGSVGVATPGALSPETGLIKNANSTHLIGHALDRDLSHTLGREVRVANDANCFALSEAADGAQAIAGEWGHNPMPLTPVERSLERRCYCGRLNCIETFLSGSGLLRDHREDGGGAKRALAVSRLAEAGDPRATRAVGRYAGRLGRALATVVNLLDPEVIVLGGGLSNIGVLYELIPPALAQHVFSDVCRTKVVPARYGDSSGVRGAAWLWPGAKGEAYGRYRVR